MSVVNKIILIGLILFFGASVVFGADLRIFTVPQGGTGYGSYTPGDMLYASGSRTLSKIASSTDGYVLQLNTNGAPAWVATTTLGIITGTVSFLIDVGDVATTSTPTPYGRMLYYDGTGWTDTSTSTLIGINKVASGGTGIISYAPGDMLYASASGILSAFASSTDGKILQLEFGTGKPSWQATSTLFTAGTDVLPAGTEGQMLYNNAGSWTAFSNMLWDDTNNRLGIGTTTPGTKLDVYGDLRVGVAGATDSSLYVNTTTGNVGIGTTTPGYKLDVYGDLRVGVAGATDSSLYVNTTTGNVGIGTTSPFRKLSVAGGGWFNEDLTASNITATGTLSVTGLASLGYASSTQLTTTGSTYLATISGNVGIGTTGPGATLDVRNSSGNISDFYSNSVLRSRLPSNGRQEWYVNSGSAEAGKIAYSTPGGYPGIIFYNGATYDQNRFNLSYYAAANVFGMAFDADGANGLWIKSGGNVGIGTTSPYATLSVAGRGVFDKDIRADYFTATSTGTASIFTFASTTAISGTNANFTNFYGALTGNVTGNADTATALASNPNDCAGGEFANAIDASGNLACAAPGASSVIGTVSTSTSPTIGQLAYWGTKDAWPEKLDSVATTTLTATSPLALDNPIYVIGPTASVLTCATAASGVAGCLSNTSFDTFNNKADLSSAMTGTFDGNNFRDGAIEAGDIWYGVSSGVLGEISSTTDGTILSLNNGIPSWIASTTFAFPLSYASSTNIVSLGSNIVPVANGGTGLSTFGGTNEVLFTSTANNLTSLDIGTGGQILSVSGSAPAWVSTTTFASGLSYASSTNIVSLSSAIGGRSLTLSGATIDTDSELYTWSFTFNVASSSLATSTFVQKMTIPVASTITEVHCNTLSGTTTIKMDERATSTPLTAGTAIMLPRQCGSGNGATSTISFSNASIAAGADVVLTIDGYLEGSPKTLYVTVKGTKDD